MQDKIFILPARDPDRLWHLPIHNLPAQLTPLIGRDQEVEAACALLRRPEVRLLTLCGTGGVGKTCLALQVAAEVQESFPDGVFYIPLAPVTDSTLVLTAIAQGLRIDGTTE